MQIVWIFACATFLFFLSRNFSFIFSNTTNTMMRAVRVHTPGGIENLIFETIPALTGSPATGHVSSTIAMNRTSRVCFFFLFFFFSSILVLEKIMKT